MAKSFDDLVERDKATWSEDAHRVYDAASRQFEAEVTERKQLGTQLAEARKARGFTQPELSKLTGIQQAEISRIERGVGNPTATTLLRLTDALGQRVALIPNGA